MGWDQISWEMVSGSYLICSCRNMMTVISQERNLAKVFLMD